MKKILNVLLIVAMLLFGSVSVQAATTQTDKGTKAATDGSITINNAVNGETYKAYRLLDLESYDNDKEAYSYSINTKWSAFFNSTDVKNVYFKLNAEGETTYATWIKSTTESDDARAAAFAKLAYNYAIKNNIAADYTEDASSTTVSFDPISLGYYLVNSSTGVVCSLDTTNNVVEIDEKNTVPVIEKTMGDGKVTTNNGSIGDVVSYTITLKNIAGLKNVVVSDSLSEGLTLNKTSVSVKNGSLDAVYTLVTEGLPSTETFEIRLNENYVNNLATGSVITITYTATINEKAVTNIANTNQAEISYGNGQKIKSNTTETYTFGFELVKTDGKDLLTGAQFRLYASIDGDDEIVLVKVSDGKYRVATVAEIEAGKGDVIEAGEVIIDGLANGTYYLEEVKAPEGYNKLARREAVTLNYDEEVVTSFTYVSKEVINTTGNILPSTGGIGTVLFVTIGSLIAMLCGFMLIVKFRMSKAQ